MNATKPILVMTILVMFGSILFADGASGLNEEMIITECDKLKASGKFDELEILCNNAIENGFNSTIIFELRGIAYWQQKNYVSALKDFELVIFSEKDNADVYYYMGSIFNEQKQYSQAISKLSKAIEIDPNFSNAYLARAAAFDGLGDYDKALEEMRNYKQTRYASSSQFITVTLLILLQKYSWSMYIFVFIILSISYILFRQYLRAKRQ